LGSGGETALIKAVKNGHKDVVEILLNHEKTDVNIKDDRDQTALSWASLKVNTEILDLLFKHPNIKVSEVNNQGHTALNQAGGLEHLNAVQGKKNAVIKMFIDDGRIDCTLRDYHYGNNVYGNAVSSGNHEEVDLLSPPFREDLPKLLEDCSAKVLSKVDLHKDVQKVLNSDIINTIADLAYCR